MKAKLKKSKNKSKKPILAICYDFDKTLTPDDMQAQGYIQSIGKGVKEFWDESNKLAEEQDMDQNLAYMYKMKEKADGKVLFTKDKLVEYGSKVELFSGVEEWFERINKFGEENGVNVEHYIISSGNREILKGTKIADKFKKIFACNYVYDENGIACWPKMIINYTSKT